MAISVGRAEWDRLEARFGLRVGPSDRRRVLQYLDLLMKWKGAVNVSGRTSVRDFLEYDFFESFWVADQFVTTAKRLVDIGAGAGFPGLGVKIRRPRLALVLVEPRLKKQVFLREVSRRLELEAVCFEGRAEDFGDWRAGDLAVMRALRAGADLVETLRREGVKLLCLHGERVPGALRAIEPQVCREVPGSERRFGSLFAFG